MNMQNFKDVCHIIGSVNLDSVLSFNANFTSKIFHPPIKIFIMKVILLTNSRGYYILRTSKLMIRKYERTPTNLQPRPPFRDLRD